MAIVQHYTQEQRDNISARLGAAFDLPDAAMKISRQGWKIESWGDEARLTVELVKTITREEAEAIINAEPM